MYSFIILNLKKLEYLYVMTYCYDRIQNNKINSFAYILIHFAEK